jgi:hypothetical protein
MTFDQRVHEALDRSPDDAVDRVQNVVIDELVAADPALEIHKTDYFNHSFIPDLVAQWDDGGKTRSRSFFLRFHIDRAPIATELARLDGDSPAFVGLADESDSEAFADDAAIVRDAIADHPSILLAEGSALAAIATPESRRGFASLIPSAVVRGGRGLLDVVASGQLGDGATSSFAAVASLDQESTRSAINTFRRYLVSDYSTDLERSLGLLWVGAGGALESFPSDLDVSAALGPGKMRTVLGILLSGQVDGTPEFWERVASWTSLADLLSFERLEPSRGLQQLMYWKRHALKAVSVAVEQQEHGRLLGE